MRLSEDGYTLLATALDAAALAAVRSACDDLVATATPTPHGIIVHDPWRRTAVLADLLPRLAATAVRLLGGIPVALFQDVLIVKPPGGVDPIHWHQDSMYWPLAASAGITLWVALDAADEANGGIVYLPGSQRRGELPAAAFAPSSEGGHGGLLPRLAVDARRAVTVPVQAGDALAHHPLVLHMSPPNRSERLRRAWSLTFVGADTTWNPARAPHPFTTLCPRRPGEPLGSEFPRFPAS